MPYRFIMFTHLGVKEYQGSLLPLLHTKAKLLWQKTVERKLVQMCDKVSDIFGGH